jgi:hypothetical protein
MQIFIPPIVILLNVILPTVILPIVAAPFFVVGGGFASLDPLPFNRQSQVHVRYGCKKHYYTGVHDGVQETSLTHVLKLH